MTARRAYLLLLAVAAALAGCAAEGASPLRHSRQLVLVVSDDWDATTARLQCYARAGVGAPWRPVGETIPVSLGRTGLAWGRGLHGQPPPEGPVKREGDGKAPAGAFELPLAFGYAPKEQAGHIRLPYLVLTDNVVGVDDVQSRYYNQLVRVDKVSAKDWDSQETMRRPDGLYEWGVLVGHNTRSTVRGAGSCIFLHIWRGPGSPTAGCTAMSRDRMMQLATWLDPRARPVLVQLPRPAYDPLATSWDLPAPP